MKTTTKISVIIAVYNVEKYLEASVRSVMNQTYRNLEIICVNDGSTDSSLDILQSLQKEDERIVVLNKPNGGLGDARNVGLEHATSEWISFIDSDDTLRPDAYDIVADAIELNPDMIHFGINMVYEDGILPSKTDEDYYTIKYDGLAELTGEMIPRVDCSAVNKVFRKSLLDRYSIRFEHILYEDFPFTIQYMTIIRKVLYIKEKLYNYQRRAGSIMMATFNKSSRAIDHLYAYNYVYSFLERNALLDKYTQMLPRLFQACYSFVIRHGNREIIPVAVEYATGLYEKSSILHDNLTKVVQNGTVLFRLKSLKKKSLISWVLERMFSIKKEFFDYELYKVIRVFGFIVYKIPKK